MADLEVQALGGATELIDGDETPTSPRNEAETGVIESVYVDDKSSLIAHSQRLLEQRSEPLDRSTTSKLLQLCCAFDSAGCAAALIAGEAGAAAVVNEADETGRTPLHAAAEYHSARCVELLLRKRARTDVRTRDGRRMLALELSLSSARLDMDGVWNPHDCSIEDLVVLLGEKDLTTIRLISEKTKELAKIACAKAMEGSVVALAALLMVAAEKINESTLEFDDADLGSKETTTTTTVYECVVREALSLGRETTTHLPSSTSLETENDTSSEMEKRKLLVAEIELLQLFGVVSRCPDKNVKSPLVRAVQARDEVVFSLLLNTNIDINEADVEGNCALHHCLKASKAFSPQEINILVLLLEHGARVGQKNKIGLTAVHMAAGNGHLQALQILLLEDPDGINYKTEMKETPLFFAVKNDRTDCAEFLLRFGANSEVLNIRRQRPIDLAKSQDMRYMLNPTNIGLMMRNFHGQQKYVTRLLEDDSNSEILLDTTDEDTSSERTCSSTATDIYKYFFAPHGCVRGAKCFYAHNGEEHRTVQRGTHQNCWPTSAMELKNRIFVGGLPLLLDSGKFWTSRRCQTGNQIQSRGFGFVTFKDEKDVSAALQAHYVFINDKKVEIKSVIAKWDDPQKPQNQRESEGKSDKYQPQAQVLSEAQGQTHASFEGQQTPTWLRIFKKWLPRFLKDMSKHQREGQYALSSLKGDFRSKFGLELDHASLGYSKLSDFMKCFSDICCTRVLPIGRGGSASHAVLLPKSLRTQQLLRRLSMIESLTGRGENCSNDSTCTPEDHTPGSCENAGRDWGQIGKVNMPNEFDVQDMSEAMLSDAQPMFMQLLEQDPLFHIRPWLRNESVTAKGNASEETEGRTEDANQNNLSLQQRHLVLEALSRSRKCPSYFLREFDFYNNYNEGVKEGKCFGCYERKVLWANFPCQHLVWCFDCKAQASIAAGPYEHKCVVCDVEVQKIDLLTCYDYRKLVGQYLFHEEFPPLDPNQIRSSSTMKISPPVLVSDEN